MGQRRPGSGVRSAISAAFEEAVRLGSGYAGPEHFLLALLRPGEETAAAQALRDCSASYEGLSAALERVAAERQRPDAEHGVSLNPVAHQLIGRAEGLAAGLGDEGVRAGAPTARPAPARGAGVAARARRHDTGSGLRTPAGPRPEVGGRASAGAGATDRA